MEGRSDDIEEAFFEEGGMKPSNVQGGSKNYFYKSGIQKRGNKVGNI